MSTTIDQRVVEMRFDNGQFESGVATTMSSINRLKQNLHFDDAARNVSLRFGAMYSYADQTMRRIADSVNHYAKRIASALTIDPIMLGFNEYETKINSIQTIMSNTASKGTTMEDVTRVIDELNTYADKTIYNFAEMTRNIGTFTAAGVGLEESAAAIQGIANLAAASGSSSQQASTAMYQLSQAMAAGTVKLMDWNSVVNAGMGGEKFQNALKATAKEHGVAIDEIIKKQGSFRESLSEGWLTTDILNETLKKFTVEGATEYANAMVKSGKYTEAQKEALIKEAQAMEDAATKVKTFTQLWSTLTESAQSGWSKTWEIIIGDFEEAKDALTKVSETIGGLINASADARNEMLENWKVLGGRKALIDGIVHAFYGIMNVIKPIKEAFRDIFPPVTSERLVEITENFRDLMKTFRDRFEEGSKAAENLKRTFRGLFALLDIGVMAFKAIGNGLLALAKFLIPVGDGLLNLTGGLGDGIVALRDYIKTTDIFNRTVGKVVGVLKKVVGGIVEVFRGIGNFSFNMITGFVERVGLRWGSLADIGESIKNGFKSVADFVKAIFSVVGPILRSLKDMLVDTFKGIGETFRDAEFSDVVDMLNAGLVTGLIMGVQRLLSMLKEVKKNGFISLFGGKGMQSFINSINDVLDGVTGSIKAFQSSIQADTLMKIAKAIGILALALFGLSLIDSEKLTVALGAITVLFADLFGSMALLSKIMGGGTKKAEATGTALQKFGAAVKNDVKNPLLEMAGVMIGVSIAVLLLAGAVAKIAKLKPEELLVGLTGVMVLLAGVTMSMKYLAKSDKDNAVAKGTKRLLAIGTAIKIMSTALIDIAALTWSQLAKGLIGFGACVVALVAVLKSMPENIPTGALKAMIGASVSLWVMSKAIEKMGSISWDVLAKGLVGMTASFALIVGGFAIMDKFQHSITNGASAMLIASISLLAMIPFLAAIGAMKWENLAKGMTSMVVIFGTMVAAFAIMDKMGTQSLLGSAAAILIMAGALMAFVPALAALGLMSWESIAKGLLTIAGAFVIVGAAAYVLAPVAGVILALGGAMALLGVGILATGIGLVAFSAGVTALGAALLSLISSIGASGVVLVDLIAAIIVGIIEGVGKGIVAFCKAIADGAVAIGEAIKAIVLEICDVVITCAPQIVNTILKLVVLLLESLVQYTPKIVGALFDFLIGVIDKLGEKIPELIKSIANFIAKVFQGVVDVFSNMDGGEMIEGIKAIGLLAGVTAALAAISAMIPAAMKGAIGLGLIAAELALVFTALGALYEIGNVEWFIERGGDLLEAIGTAIGQFIGGIAGGIAKGFTGSLPEIADDLSNFMKNLQPFIDGASGLSEGTFSGVKSLVGVIKELAGANMKEKFASIITGDSSMSKFAEELPTLGEGLSAFSDSVKGIDQNGITAAVEATKKLAEMADTIPNEGGMKAWFAGDNSVADFGAQLPALGEGLKGFSDSVAGIVPDNITAAANAAKMLAEMTNVVPNSGGVVSWFAGDNSLAQFSEELSKLGEGLKSLSSSAEGISPENLKAVIESAKALAEMTAVIPNEGGMVAWFTGDNSIAKFGNELPRLGKGLKKFSESVDGINAESMMAAAGAAKVIAEMTAIIPNEGGMVAWFTGDNSIAKFGNELPKLGKGLKKFSESVEGIVPESVNAAVSTAKSLAEMSSVIPNQGGMVAWFTGDNSLAKFGNELPKLGNGLKSFSDSVTGIVPENVTAAANAAKSLAEMANVIPNAGGVASWFAGENSVSKFGSELIMLGMGMQGFSVAVAGINPESVTAAANAAKALADLVAVIPSEGGIKAWFAGEASVANFAENLPALGKGLKGFSDSVAEVNPENVTAASNAAKALAEMTAVIPKEGGIKAWFTGKTSIANFADKLPGLGDGLMKFSESVEGINPDNVTAAANAAKSLAEMLDNAPSDPKDVSKLGKHLVEMSEKMKTYYTNMSSISDESISLAGKALSAVKEIGGINAENIKSVASAIKDLTKAVKDMAKGIKSDLKDAGKEAIEAFIKGIKDNTSSAEKACKTMVSDCAKAISDKASSFETAGKNLVKGFRDGIDKNTYMAEAKARAMAKAAYKAAKEELDINSPSKVFRELGTSIPEGMAAGIDKLSKVVGSSSESMSDDAIRGASNSIASIADIINRDIDAQPTIRPVLDLDEVRAGANSIANMFNARASVSMMGNVGAINSMMNSRNQNGDNVVSAIDKLRKDIGEMEHNTYQINGVSYNENSDVADAIQTLINALVREGRA